MAPVTLGRTTGLLALVGAGFCILASGPRSATPQFQSSARSSQPSRQTRTIKRTWQNRPASMPLETEVVPPHPSPIPPIVRDQALGIHSELKANVGDQPANRPSAGSTVAATRKAAAPLKTQVTTTEGSDANSEHVNADRRALDDLQGLRADPGARQAFYEDLRRTVEQVRAGEKHKAAGAADKAPAAGATQQVETAGSRQNPSPETHTYWKKFLPPISKPAPSRD